MHYALYTIQCTLYTIQCTLCTIHSARLDNPALLTRLFLYIHLCSTCITSYCVCIRDIVYCIRDIVYGYCIRILYTDIVYCMDRDIVYNELPFIHTFSRVLSCSLVFSRALSRVLSCSLSCSLVCYRVLSRSCIHLHTPFIQLDNIHCTMYTVHCTLYIINHTLYDLHYTP